MKCDRDLVSQMDLVYEDGGIQVYVYYPDPDVRAYQVIDIYTDNILCWISHDCVRHYKTHVHVPKNFNNGD